MKLKYVILTISLYSMCSFAAESQSKYLGEKQAEDEKEDAVLLPKINLLDESVIQANPHFQNDAFWSERSSSKIIDTQIVSKDLSDALFDMVKGVSESPGVGLTESKDTSKSRDKNFKPPKKALIGNDHHHQYTQIQESFEGSYNPYRFNSHNREHSIGFEIEDKRWAKDSFGRSILVTDISLQSEAEISYENKVYVILPVSEHLMENLLPITVEDLDITVLNENKDELVSADYDFVLRDVCVVNKVNDENILFRLTVTTNNLLINDMRIFSGIKCSAASI